MIAPSIANNPNCVFHKGYVAACIENQQVFGPGVDNQHLTVPLDRYSDVTLECSRRSDKAPEVTETDVNGVYHVWITCNGEKRGYKVLVQ